MENPTYTEKTVGELVAEQPARAAVFEKFRLDYCCGGKITVEQSCARRGVDSAAVFEALAACDSKATAPVVDWTSAPLSELCDHIESTHHHYLREALPRLSELSQKVARRHGEDDPRLVEVARIFEGLRAELEQHMMKEERILFPMIRMTEVEGALQEFHCGTMQAPISVMIAEHDDAGEALEAMSTLTDRFTPPEHACNTYRALFFSLNELEQDMHRHVHKENSILFPRALELESSLAAGV